MLATSGRLTYQDEPSPQQLKKLQEKWLAVQSWTATYEETYSSQNTWESSPGMVYEVTIESTIKGRYTLDEFGETDGEYYGEWYGYGTGSLNSKQVVTMTSDGLNGRIVITETTETKASGAIGDPSLNEYGEYWGASLSIDLYNGTYGAGFAGPEDGEATFTRTVEGLPTDYSDLEKLPEGLREIFVPIGDKVEEWATYSGPLEDAEAINPVGLFGLDFMHDFDEPTEYELPGRGTTLKGSYSGKSIKKKWSLQPGNSQKPLTLEKVDKEWIPDPAFREPATVKVTGNGLNGEKVRIRFILHEVTNEKGFCMNSENKDESLDLQFDEINSSAKFKKPIQTEDGWIIETKDKVLNASVDVLPLDYGAWGKLKAEFELDDDEWRRIVCQDGSTYITIPTDERGGLENKIADQFEINNGFSERIETMQDDEGINQFGDGLTAYEEYRGFMIGGDAGSHITTHPENTMDLFTHCESQVIRKYISKTLNIQGDIEIHLLDSEKDYVSKSERVINPNRGEWSICEQHGIRLINEDIPEQGVVGWAVGQLNSPGSTDYISVDLKEIKRLNMPNGEVIITVIHELLHGCSIDHHGEDNEEVMINGALASIALWNGINAGDLECVMQYGWGDYYKLKDGSWAVNNNNLLIPFQDTDHKIIASKLCSQKNGVSSSKSTQLGPAQNGQCEYQARITDN